MKKHHLHLTLKILIIMGSFALVFSKIDLAKFALHLKEVEVLPLLLALLCLILAQIVCAFRTRLYFSTEGLYLNSRFAVALYFVGMLLNNILPGGIGGDGYKVYLLGKLSHFKHLTAVRLLVSDRASGLLVLALIALAAIGIGHITPLLPYGTVLVPLALILVIPTYFLSIRLLLKEQPLTALRAMPYSFVAQSLGILIVLILLNSLNVPFDDIELIARYIALFSIATIASILPISIGGVGLREVVMTFGATWVGADPEIGVAIALLFFAIYMLASLIGLVFLHRLDTLYHTENSTGADHGSTTNP